MSTAGNMNILYISVTVGISSVNYYKKMHLSSRYSDMPRNLS